MASSSSTCHSNCKISSSSTGQLLHPSMASTSLASSGFTHLTQAKTPQTLHPPSGIGVAGGGGGGGASGLSQCSSSAVAVVASSSNAPAPASSSSAAVVTSGCPILHLNKRGNPIYSREDIREQYCINSKELQVFDAGLSGHSSRLFGCLSTSHLPDHGPCSSSRSEHLFSLSSCVKRKASLDSIKRVSR